MHRVISFAAQQAKKRYEDYFFHKNFCENKHFENQLQNLMNLYLETTEISLKG
jgi:hypothetical protein